MGLCSVRYKPDNYKKMRLLLMLLFCWMSCAAVYATPVGSEALLRLDAEQAELSVRLDQPPPEKLPLTLLLALPRPKMLRRVLQTVSAMGVPRLILLNSYRVEKSFWQTPFLEPAAIREQLILGLEQARDTVLPEVIIEKRFKPFVEDQLPGIAAGETIATLASTEPSGKWDEAGITMAAKGSGAKFTLDGTKMFVIDGHTASLILVAARTAKGVSLFAVDGNAKGLTRTALSTMDQTRKQAKLEFKGVEAELIGTEGKGWEVLSKVFDLAAVALAAEQVGGAQKVLDMAVEYAKVRVQFGRPIGSFQAIKHKCADMLLEVESAKSAAYYGMWCAAEMNDELPSVASLSKAYCSEAYFHAAAENIQIHGGIGFTWEHPAHLYFKRAKSSELLFGDPTYHRELLAQRIGI